MKEVVAAFNQEKALVGAFSVIMNLRMELFEALNIMHVKSVDLSPRVTAYCPGADPDEHVLGASGSVLDAGAGRPAAQQRHDLHEPAHHRTASRQQKDREEENHGDTQPQANV